jgi:hypothetical protein
MMLNISDLDQYSKQSQTVSRFATKHPPAYSDTLCFGCKTDKK